MALRIWDAVAINDDLLAIPRDLDAAWQAHLTWNGACRLCAAGSRALSWSGATAFKRSAGGILEGIYNDQAGGHAIDHNVALTPNGRHWTIKVAGNCCSRWGIYDENRAARALGGTTAIQRTNAARNGRIEHHFRGPALGAGDGGHTL
jgi:hypothetical protein